MPPKVVLDKKVKARPLNPETKPDEYASKIQTLANAGLIKNTTPAEVKKNHIKLRTHVESNYKSPATIAGHLQAITHYLKLANAGPILQNRYARLSTYYRKLDSEQKANNLRSKNNYTLKDLSAKVDELYEKFKQNPTPKNINKLLSLALNVLQPPLRKQEYPNMLVVKEYPVDADYNYLVVRPNTIRMVVNKFKTKGKGSHPESFKAIVPPPLAKMIKETLKAYPREWLLSHPKDPTNPLGTEAYGDVLNDVLGEGYGMNQIRSIYASYMLSTKGFSANDKERLAKRMLTSVSEIERVYKNVGLDSEADIRIKELEKELAECRKEIDKGDEEEEESKAAKVEEEKPVPKEAKPLPKAKDPEYQRQQYLKRKESGTQKPSGYEQDPKGFLKRQTLQRMVKGDKVRDSTLKKYGITQSDIDEFMLEK